VRLCEGKWQDVIPQLIAEGKKFDAIFFDTYAEHYTHMQVRRCGGSVLGIGS
jgi:protein arginine N-methyltransferase 2